MKFWISAGVALAMAGFTLCAADAQTGPQAGGGQFGGGKGGALREACRADVEQLCSGVEPGGGHIMQCLRDHQDRVSSTCKSAISEAHANRRGGPVASPDQTPPAPN
jgi:hypothetical protein